MQTACIAEVGERAAEVIEQKLCEFCRLLRAHGMQVTTGRMIDIFRALQAIDVFQRDDFYTALEANVVARASDREVFRQLFLQFWSGPAWVMPPDPCLPALEEACAPPPPVLEQAKMHVGNWDLRTDEVSEAPQQTVALYSPQEVLTRKDFGTMAAHELLRVQRLITAMARELATRMSRRKKAGVKAHMIDPGRTMRRSLRYGGEVMELVRRGPKLGKTKMVVLCDISGSMDIYSTFLIQFLYGIQNGLRGVETIVFSTRVTRITPLLRRRNIDAALRLIADTVQDWSGGTKIGACLHEFNTTMAANMVTSKTVVIIISDGWDTGDTVVLDGAMARLRRMALCVIWLNPLLGSANYQPLCKGIQTALPYVHHFLPVHNVESLRQFGHLVASVI
ncbi:MAG TPA: VWA domain-containing protein [Candidatus Tectomicrobia bacterium]